MKRKVGIELAMLLVHPLSLVGDTQISMAKCYLDIDGSILATKADR